MIRKAIATDLAAVVDIYNETIASRIVTADLTPVSYQERQAWFDGHTDLRPLFVYQSGSEILGWVSFKTFYGRPAYQGTVEISIYVASHARGQGIAKQLLDYAEHYAQTIAVNVFFSVYFLVITYRVLHFSLVMVLQIGVNYQKSLIWTAPYAV